MFFWTPGGYKESTQGKPLCASYILRDTDCREDADFFDLKPVQGTLAAALHGAPSPQSLLSLAPSNPGTIHSVRQSKAPLLFATVLICKKQQISHLAFFCHSSAAAVLLGLVFPLCAFRNRFLLSGCGSLFFGTLA